MNNGQMKTPITHFNGDLDKGGDVGEGPLMEGYTLCVLLVF